MQTTINDKKLSNYFQNKANVKEKIPYMTKIAKETGISLATISRFAKRKGFYSFPEMRAQFNKGLGPNTGLFNDYGLLKKIDKNKKLFIITSNNSKIISHHIFYEFTKLGFTVIIKNDNESIASFWSKFTKNDCMFIFSITRYSRIIEYLISNNITTPNITIISLQEIKKLKNVIVLPKTSSNFSEKIEENKALQKLFNWTNEIIFQYLIILKNKKTSSL